MTKKYLVTIDKKAMERCFLVAEILAETSDQPFEYGMLGLAAQSNPFHIVSTPLLPGQKVSSCSVYQAGQDVFRLRNEMELIGKKIGQKLVPVAFIHRHPGMCGMSFIDREFLIGPFVDQVSTAVNLNERRTIQSDEFNCCRKIRKAARQRRRLKIDYGVCFSIIVNGQREHSIDAAYKFWCPLCDKPSIRIIPAELRVIGKWQLSKRERYKLKKQLEVEVETKIRFPSYSQSEEHYSGENIVSKQDS